MIANVYPVRLPDELLHRSSSSCSCSERAIASNCRRMVHIRILRFKPRQGYGNASSTMLRSPLPLLVLVRDPMMFIYEAHVILFI